MEARLLEYIENKDVDKVKYFLDNVVKNNINIDINKGNKSGEYPFLWAIIKDNIEIVKIIIKYAKEKNIILKINEKDKFGDYPFLYSIIKNNIEITNLIVNYANENNITLEIREKNKDGFFPILLAISNNNTEMVKLILNYANKINTILNISEKDIEHIITRNLFFIPLKNISNIDKEIIKLLYIYKKEHKIEIIFNVNSELLTKFEEVSNTSISYENINQIETKMLTNNTTNINSTVISKVHDSIIQVSTINNCENGDLAIALYDFNGAQLEELSIYKNEYLIVTNWNIKNGWVYGYKKNNPEKKGIFPFFLISKCKTTTGTTTANTITTSILNSTTTISTSTTTIDESKNNQGENDNTSLIYECINGNEEKIKYLIEHGADINMKNSDGDTPLIILCKIELENSFALVKYLVDHGANVNIANDDDRKTPLMYACKKNKNLISKYLIEKNADVNYKNKNGETPLIIASKNENEELVEYLINHGANIFEKDVSNNSALSYAIKKINKKIIEFLNKSIKENNNYLTYSYKNVNGIEIIKVINNKNIYDINSLNEEGDTLLIDACKNENENEIEKLIENGADVNKKNYVGDTPLTISCEIGNQKIIEYLIEKGADMEINNSVGISPINILCKMENKNSLNILQYLVEKGINLNNKDKNKISPLLMSCYFTNEIIATYLISKCLNINIQNKNGDSPLIVSCYFNNIVIIKSLIENHADINLKNKNNETPLIVAKRIKNKEIKKYIKSKLATENIEIYVKVLQNFKGNNSDELKIKKGDIIKVINKKLRPGWLYGYKINNRDIKEKINLNFENIKKDDNINNNNDSIGSVNNVVDIEMEIESSKFHSVEMTSKIIDIAKKSICLIEFEESGNVIKGTGFLIRLPIPTEENSMFGLITNNHILNSKHLKHNKSYMININNKQYKINIDKENFIFTSELIDITFIQLIDEKLIKNQELDFMIPNINNNMINESNKLITIIQYPHGKGPYFSEGYITNISGFNYFHTISTRKGSSGSPLITKDMKVIGIHKSSIKNKNINVATKYSVIEHAIRTLYNKKYIYKMKKSRKLARELSFEEINVLKNHGLYETSFPNIYKCPYSNSSLLLLFYRTNHGWYWSSKKELDDNYELKFISTFDWELINPYKSIESNINDNVNLDYRHKLIITWLKLSELMTYVFFNQSTLYKGLSKECRENYDNNELLNSCGVDDSFSIENYKKSCQLVFSEKCKVLLDDIKSAFPKCSNDKNMTIYLDYLNDINRIQQTYLCSLNGDGKLCPDVELLYTNNGTLGKNVEYIEICKYKSCRDNLIQYREKVYNHPKTCTILEFLSTKEVSLNCNQEENDQDQEENDQDQEDDDIISFLKSEECTSKMTDDTDVSKIMGLTIDVDASISGANQIKILNSL
eukprot:jgi/Orpsp1_1/1184103/evm.model.c7180000088024.1